MAKLKYVSSSSVQSLVFPFSSQLFRTKANCPSFPCLHPSRTLTPEATGQAHTITEANPPGKSRGISPRWKPEMFAL